LIKRNWGVKTKFDTEMERAAAQEPFTAEKVALILHNCDVKDLIGIPNAQDLLINHVLYVPCKMIRPSSLHNSTKNGRVTLSENDLTVLLLDILKCNEDVKSVLDAHEGVPISERTKSQQDKLYNTVNLLQTAVNKVF